MLSANNKVVSLADESMCTFTNTDLEKTTSLIMGLVVHCQSLGGVGVQGYSFVRPYLPGNWTFAGAAMWEIHLFFL